MVCLGIALTCLGADNFGYDSDDPELDTLLVTLGKKDNHGKGHDVGELDAKNVWDELDGMSDDNLEMPCFEVAKEHDGDPKGQGGDDDDSCSYVPTSPRSPLANPASDEGDAGSEGGEADDGGDVDLSHARLPRFPHTADRSSEQPPGCICRKYEPPGGTPYLLVRWVTERRHGLQRHSRPKESLQAWATH